MHPQSHQWVQAPARTTSERSVAHVARSTPSLPARALAVEERALELLHDGFVYLCSAEVFVGLACFIGVCCFMHRLISRRPRAVSAMIGSWFAFFVVDLMAGRGPAACLKEATERGIEAFQASREVAHSLVKFFVAWLRLLMPVLADIATLLAASWDKLTPRQRLLLCASVLSVYAVLLTFRVIRRHSSTINGFLFQTAFFLVGPFVWILTGFLSPRCLHWSWTVVLLVLPTLLSFDASRRRLVKQEPNHPQHNAGVLATLRSSEEWCRMWLSFWACWPLLMILRFATQRLPQVLPEYWDDEFLLPSELDRAFIVLTLWVQFWQGSFLINHTLRSFSVMLNLGILAAPCALAKRLASTFWLGPRASTLLDVSRFLSSSSSMFGQSVIMMVVLGIVIVTWTFYQAFRLACGIMTLAALFFVAMESANVAISSSGDLYVKRLSFWVFLQIWTTLVQTPIVGAGLGLATPIVMSFFFLAGDHLLRWLLIPLAEWLETLPNALLVSLVAGSAQRSDLSAKKGSNEKPEEVTVTSSRQASKGAGASKYFQSLERTLFGLFVTPVAESFGFSNVSRVMSAV